jgi:ribosome-associated protein
MYVELNTFLKLTDIANTGGHAKILIRGNTIRVNGELETRVRRKLHSGDIVEFENKKIVVQEEVCKMIERRCPK